MLRSLYVKNLAVAADVGVEFGPGLNILSGETGAGKSILVDSLGLLAGARATAELIRSDAEELTVTGSFDEPPPEVGERLAEAGLSGPRQELVVRRVVSRSGRNQVYLDDEPVTLRLLSSLAPHLLRIHTQREELGLVSPEVQRRWLDASAGDEAVGLRTETADAYADYRRLEERWQRVTGDQRLRLERLDLLRFQVAEIDDAGLVSGEEDELRTERQRLRHGEAIGQAIGGSLGLVFDDEGAALDRLAQSEKLLAGIEAWEPEAEAWGQELRELRLRLEDLATTLRRHFEGVDLDPGGLDRLEARLASIERLLRKYGESSVEVLEHRERIGRELEELEADDTRRDELEAERTAALKRYAGAARRLSEARSEWGEALSRRVLGELSELAMAKARFATELGRRRRADSPLRIDGESVDFGAAGYDEVTLLLAANPGEEMGPVAKVASGGELSRVYLALQLAARLQDGEGNPTLVFDEVDAGIGGAVAAALGRKLGRLSRHGQVLAVTHLPQVASFADHHFRILKQVESGRTRMEIRRLEEDERVEEVARMLAGHEVTDLSRSHARELIAGAGQD